jgi:hypothetical protein
MRTNPPQENLEAAILKGTFNTTVIIAMGFLFLKNPNNGAFLSQVAVMMISADASIRAVSDNRYGLFSATAKIGKEVAKAGITLGKELANYYKYQMDELEFKDLSDETLEEIAEDFASQGEEQVSARAMTPR